MVGQLIKEARTNAKLTQEQLAWAVGGLTARDISRAEREEVILSNDDLKRIAKACKVTQKSLLDAAKLDAAAAQPVVPDLPLGGMPPMPMDLGGDAPLRGAIGPAARSNSSSVMMELSSTERKLIEKFRACDSATKKAINKLAKGDSPDLVDIVNNGLPPFNPFGRR